MLRGFIVSQESIRLVLDFGCRRGATLQTQVLLAAYFLNMFFSNLVTLFSCLQDSWGHVVFSPSSFLYFVFLIYLDVLPSFQVPPSVLPSCVSHCCDYLLLPNVLHPCPMSFLPSGLWIPLPDYLDCLLCSKPEPVVLFGSYFVSVWYLFSWYYDIILQISKCFSSYGPNTPLL